MLNPVSSKTTVTWGNYQFPQYFFYDDKKDSSFISPAAAFDPNGALEGKAWQSSTAPAETLKPKSLVITRTIIDRSFYSIQLLPLLYWFHQRGFPVYTYGRDAFGEKIVIKFDPKEHLKNDTFLNYLLNDLTYFDDDFYIIFNKYYQVEKRKILVIEQQKIDFVNNLPYLKDQHKLNNNQAIYSNDFMAVVPLVTLTEKPINDEGINTIKTAVDFISALKNYPHKRHEIIKKYSHTLTSVDHIAYCFMNFPEEKTLLFESFNLPAIHENINIYFHIALRQLPPGYQPLYDLLKSKANYQDSLFYFINHYPQHAPYLIEQMWDTVCQRPNHLFVQKYPEKSIELLTIYRQKIKEGVDLGEMLLAYPQLSDELLIEHADVIIQDSHAQTYSHFYLCIDRYPPAFNYLFERFKNKLLADRFQLSDILLKLVKSKKISAETVIGLLDLNESDIQNSDELSLFLIGFPQHASSLISRYSKLITDIDSLTECCENLQDINLTKKLIEQYMNQHTNQHRIFRLVYRRPELLKWLLDKYFTRASLSYVHSSYYALATDLVSYLIPVDNVAFFETAIARQRRLDSLAYFLDKNKLNDLAEKILHIPKEEPQEFLNVDSLYDKTYLYLGDTHCIQQIIDLIEQDKLSNLISLSITNWTKDEFIQPFFNAINKHCPLLSFIELPASLSNKVSEFLPCSTRFRKSINKKILNNTPDQRNQSNLFIAANGKLNHAVKNSSKNPEFIMLNVGKLLNDNGQSKHRVRTALLKLSADFCEQRIIKANLQKIATPKQLSQHDIEQFKRAAIDTHYYYFETKLTKNKPTRLFSVDAHEELEGLLQTYSHVQFYRGNDTFFYAISAKDCVISYIVSADSVEKTIKKYEAVPKSHPIKQLISEYKSSPKYKHIGFEKDVPTFDKKNIDGWYAELFEKRAGTCRHRCWSLCYFVSKKYPELYKSIYLLGIDDNHLRIQFLYQNHWYQIDLGGGQANLKYQDKPLLSHSLTQQPTTNLVKQSKTRELLQERYQLHSLTQLNQLQAVVVDNIINNTLLVAQELENCANFIISEALKNNIPLFYLDNNKLFKGKREHITLINNIPTLSLQDELDQFLHEIEGTGKGILLLNWDKIQGTERVALNTALDPKKSLFGRQLPSQVKTLSLISVKTNDISLLARHQQHLTCNMRFPNTQNLLLENSIIIDVQGFPDWRSFLFGKIVLHENQLLWNKGPLTTCLSEAKNTHIIIKNLAQESINEVNYELMQAKANGAFNYHGQRLALPNSTVIELDTKPIDLSQFSVIAFSDYLVNKCPIDCQFINTVLFDYVLQQHEIHNQQYLQKPGLIKQANNSRLYLYISDNLSKSQWYCLFAQAKMHQVELILYLAPRVVIPQNITLLSTSSLNKISQCIQVYGKLIISENPEEIAFLNAKPKTISIAVEDYTYQDLIKKIDYQYQAQQGFTNFTEQQSDIIHYLNQGYVVNIYGEFPKELLQALSPLLLIKFSGQLNLILDSSKNKITKPTWLPAENWHTVKPQKTRNAQPPIIEEKIGQNAWDNINLEHSESDTQRFVQNRIHLILSALEHHTLLQLVGDSGVGKTTIMTYLAKSINVYYELDSIESWANDKSEKLKVLFIDEINIINQHLTRFSPLKHRANYILHQLKLLPLDGYHRVIGARNAHNYGGGRNEQKLFADRESPEIHLQQLPPAVIYELLLKPFFYQLKLIRQHQIGLKRYKDDCRHFLKLYWHKKQLNPHSITIRNVQEWLFNYVQQQNKSIGLFIHGKPSAVKTNYTLLPSTLPIRLALKKFLINHRYNQAGMGLNGFLIEGRSGLGKSELIHYQLIQAGLKQANHNLTNNPSNQCYYKLDASLSLEEKTRLCLQAAQERNIVWVDEINSCLDDGFEKICNTLLSGFNPFSGQKLDQAVFRLIVTANGLEMDGRSLIGPALRGRLNQYSMPLPGEEDFSILIKQHLTQEQQAEINSVEMANSLAQICQETPNFSLRDIVPRLADIAKDYQLDKERLDIELIKAVKMNCLNILLRILQHPNFNSSLLSQYDDKNKTAFHWALDLNYPHLLQTLLASPHCTTDVLQKAQLLIPAVQCGQFEFVKYLFNRITFDKSMINQAIDIAEQINHQALTTWLTNALTPSKYREITQELLRSPMERAKIILRDYTKDNSRFSRIIHFHWNRHHVQEINRLLYRFNQNPQATPNDLLQALDSIPLVNQTGSLAKRIHYIKYELFKVDESNLSQKANSGTLQGY